MQVILHSDVGQRLLPPTVTEYRGLTRRGARPGAADDGVPARGPRTAGHPRRGDPHPGRHRRAPRQRPGAVRTVAGLLPLRRPDPRAGGAVRRRAAGRARSGIPHGRAGAHGLRGRDGAVDGRDLAVRAVVRGPQREAARPEGVRVPARARTAASRSRPRPGRRSGSPTSCCIQPNPAAVETRLYLYGLRDLEGQGVLRGRVPGGPPHPGRVDQQRGAGARRAPSPRIPT